MTQPVILFSGQGAQKVGMTRDWIESSALARELADKADAALGYSLAEILGLRHRVVDACGGAGNHDLPRGVEVGDIDSGGCGELADLFLISADQGGHGSVGRIAGFLHERAALGNQLEAIDERESPGGGVGGEFTKRKPGCGGGLETGDALFQKRQPDQAVQVKGGLALRGGRESNLAVRQRSRE